MSLKLSVDARNAVLDAIIAQAGPGALIRIYDGSRPENVGTAITSQTLLGTLTGGSPLAPAAANGEVTLNPITQDNAADASGTASFFRVFKADGTTPVIDGDCGTSDADMILNSTTIVAGGPIQISSAKLVAPGA